MGRKKERVNVEERNFVKISFQKLDKERGL